MSVYVDRLRDYGWRLGPSCHMVADTLDELHAMAERIGLKRSWFQDKASAQHYDLTASRRSAAVEAGAREVDRTEFVAIIRRLRASNAAAKLGVAKTAAEEAAVVREWRDSLLAPAPVRGVDEGKVPNSESPRGAPQGDQ